MVFDQPHRRLNLLSGEWVLVSPGRTDRPWQGAEESIAASENPEYDPTCYLCPGNLRASGLVNPEYQETYVFENDWSALHPNIAVEQSEEGLLVSRSQPGVCRVICYSPRHDLHFSTMNEAQLNSVVGLWVSQQAELSNAYGWVQIFENRGEASGASSPHPHGQIWATAELPSIAVREIDTQRDHFERHGTRLLADYLEQERALDERVVSSNRSWTAVVPYWAVWPFETLIVANAPISSIAKLDEEQRADLGSLLGGLYGAFDRVFGVPFPLSMGWHSAPGATGGEADSYWQLHAHVFPPLLRSATVRKHMVGYELLAEPQRDITAEQAAVRLRSLVSES